MPILEHFHLFQQPTHSEQKPSQSSKNYIKGVLHDYEEHSNYDDALKEYKELLTAKDIHVGMSTLGPVLPFKEEKVTEEQREYKPNLAGILLTGCKDKVKNSSLAWREYTDFIVKHKKAVCLLLSLSRSINQQLLLQ